VEGFEEGRFGAATLRGEGREGDDQGAFGEAGGAGPAFGDGEEHRALVGLEERFGRGGLAEGGAEAGGEAAESIGELRGEGGNVVEGEGPVVAGEGEEVADGGRDGGKGRVAGIDERAEDAGGEGFAGGGRTLEDKDGVWTGGAEGGEEPGEAAEPGGAGREVEAGAERIEGGWRVRRGRHRFGDGEGGAGSLEENAGAGGGLPSGGIDVDELARGIGEVEEDSGGVGARTAASDTTPDGEAAVVMVVMVGLGLEEMEDSVEFAGGGQGVVAGVEFAEEPMAEFGGADGKDGEASGGVDGEAKEGLAVGGGEGDAEADDGEVPLVGVGLHDFLSIPE